MEFIHTFRSVTSSSIVVFVEKYLRARRGYRLEYCRSSSDMQKTPQEVTFSMELDVITGFRTGCSIMDQPILINERFVKKIPGGAE